MTFYKSNSNRSSSSITHRTKIFECYYKQIQSVLFDIAAAAKGIRLLKKVLIACAVCSIHRNPCIFTQFGSESSFVYICHNNKNHKLIVGRWTLCVLCTLPFLTHPFFFLRKIVRNIFQLNLIRKCEVNSNKYVWFDQMIRLSNKHVIKLMSVCLQEENILDASKSNYLKVFRRWTKRWRTIFISIDGSMVFKLFTN